MHTNRPFIKANENNNLIMQHLQTNPTTLDIFGYSFIYKNLNTLTNIALNNVTPSFKTTTDNSYPVAHPLYFYIKNTHHSIIPNMQKFIKEYMSKNTLAPNNYLSKHNIVPLINSTHAATQTAIITGKTMATKQ